MGVMLLNARLNTVTFSEKFEFEEHKTHPMYALCVQWAAVIIVS